MVTSKNSKVIFGTNIDFSRFKGEYINALVLTGVDEFNTVGLKDLKDYTVGSKNKFPRIICTLETKNFLKKKFKFLSNTNFYCITSGNIFDLYGVKYTPFETGDNKIALVFTKGFGGKGSVLFIEEIPYYNKKTNPYMTNVDNYIINNEDFDTIRYFSAFKPKRLFQGDMPSYKEFVYNVF